MMAIALATFQATLRPVFMFTAGPKIVAPASCARRNCSTGHAPASRAPSHSSSPCMPSTNSEAMPSSMLRSGQASRSRRTALSTARKSASPAAPVVSKFMPSAPASHIASPMRTMSSSDSAAASSWAARASSMRPSGRSCDQLGHGPSGFE